MAKKTINVGTTANDGTGDPLRTALTKANENFTELYDAKQPLNENLTAVAELTTTAFGRARLTDADEVAAKAALSLAKADVGLGSVDNTADSAKPVSTAQQTALSLKANLASPTFTGTVGGISKGMVGLGNVDNTADAAKPVSTATQTALNLKANLASPALTGTPTAPTAAAGTSTTQVATTAFVLANAGGGSGGDSLFTGYVPGRYYSTVQAGAVNTGQSGSEGSLHLWPFYIFDDVTISELGVRIATASAGGLFQLGIYAHDPVSGDATGTPIVSVDNLSTTTAGNVVGAVTPTLITPGLYWAAYQKDNGTVVAVSPINNSLILSITGATTADTLLGGGTINVLFRTFARAYGAGLPDLTGATFGNQINSRGAAVYFRTQP